MRNRAGRCRWLADNRALDIPLPPGRFYLILYHERPLTPAAEQLAQPCEYESRAGAMGPAGGLG
ncbi:hypothetical protein SAMN05421848_1042 [Kushneria avicenniae]|uniref:Uncharacterized protein n=1 Tax=Kushneria avicenniae TaxID=402385 RepID=A0A1I1ICT8_9GAMM|nr:hypothetical protein [Kushneria avicenniae]SFC32028.1 hypothetical protein SAMN05421848_1042 [Kushneria avicenniae]